MVYLLTAWIHTEISHSPYWPEN